MLTRLSKLLSGFTVPLLDYPFAASDVAMYWRTVSNGADAAIDAQTWKDMLLEQYAGQLARQTSIFGQQMLHDRLCGGAAHTASIARVRALAQDAAGLAQLEQATLGLRRSEAEIAEVLFGAPPPAAPRWSRYLPCLPLALIVSAGLGFVWAAGWLLACGFWLALMAVQMRFYDRAQQWERLTGTMLQLLNAHKQLGALEGAAADAHAAAMRPGHLQAGRIGSKLVRSALMLAMPGAREYSEWLWLANIRHYFASCDYFLAQRGFLRDSYLLVANLEADMALARHLRQAPRSCWADVAADGGMALDDVVHPLLDGAAPLTFRLQGRGAFISGQNGVGKSTLLRTVGLNLIAARAFGFCYAHAASVPLLPVYSSMQGEDSLAGGESLYQSELRRAQELLAQAGRQRSVFLIDEIFRGTNHLESISAAAAVLHALARDGMVVVSSHNLVLAPLLRDCLTPFCVRADGAGLRIMPGVLAQTNGIALLAARGFGREIEANAGRVFDWLHDYMAHPAECGQILSPPEPAYAPGAGRGACHVS